jgi:CheY-like chemotaxis protein
LRAWKTAGGHRRILRSSIEEVLRSREKELERRPSTQRHQLTIVVVEDEPDLLKLYELNFAAWKLPVELKKARDGFEGLVRVGEYHPALLITDLNMPGMDGFRMIRTLRSSPEFRYMQIAVVTALGKNEIADRGGLPNDVAVFTKPVPFSELEALVRRKLKSPAAKRA